MKGKWREKVDMIINDVSEKEGVNRSEGRTMVHKYVCGGKCGWYKTDSRLQQARSIGEAEKTGRRSSQTDHERFNG